MVGHGKTHQRARHQIVLDHRQRHVAPADPLPQQRVLGAKIGQTPGARAEHRIILSGGEARAIRQHQLDMLAPGARLDRHHACQRMVGRGHRHHRDRSCRAAVDPVHPCRKRAGHAYDRLAIQHQRGDRAQRLGVKPQLHRRKCRREIAQNLTDPLGRQHHVQRQIDLGLQPIQHTLHFGTQAVDPLRDRLGLGQNGASLFGQLRSSRAFARKQGDAQLHLQIGDAVADDRDRAVELAACTCETAGLHNGQEDRQLVERRRAGIVHFSISSNRLMDFIYLNEKDRNPYKGLNKADRSEAPLSEEI